jgi:hypothetical protein
MKASKSNPARSASQYGAAQAVRTGASRIMPRQVAEELIAETPRHKRRQFARELAARRRPNQAQTAAELSEQFHGRPVDRVTEVSETMLERAELAELGRLLELRVVTFAGDAYVLSFQRTHMRLCATPDGSQLYLVGGDQDVDLDSLGIDDMGKDDLPLGVLTAIVYHTTKGFHDFEPTDYIHDFGEEGGEPPLLSFDRLNRALRISGGSYRVEPAGIVD